VKIASTGALTLYVTKVVANVETTLTSLVLPSSANYTVGSSLVLRLQVVGTTPTTVQAKLWRSGTTEPTAWMVTTTDSTDGLQVPGGVALVTYLSGSTTNQPVVISFDDLVAQPS
jgi:predicted aconitase with swiveling domain